MRRLTEEELTEMERSPGLARLIAEIRAERQGDERIAALEGALRELCDAGQEAFLVLTSRTIGPGEMTNAATTLQRAVSKAWEVLG